VERAQEQNGSSDPSDRLGLLSTDELTVKFGSPSGALTAVNQVSLEVGAREVVGLVGESGCGKSVYALAIMRLLPPPPRCTVAGKVYFRGQDLTAMADRDLRKLRGRRISMIFQEPLSALNPVFTVGNQVAEVYRVHHRATRKKARSQAVDMLARVGLSDPLRRARQYPHELSGGMRQRVLIAMALASEPELLIADEPTTALDVTVQAQILELLKRLKDEFGLGVLFITHDLAVVAQLCSRVTVLYAGRVVEEGPTPEVFSAPLHPYTAGLLDSLPENAVSGSGAGARARPKEIEGSLPTPSAVPKGCTFEPRCPKADSSCVESEPELESGTGERNRRIRCYHPLGKP
jgi:oligopeptide/dipeptide ABC transporter ATP-binding protein